MSQLTDYLHQHPKQVLIFDFDNTLFHLELPWDEYIDEVLKIIEKEAPEWEAQHLDSVSFVNNYIDVLVDVLGKHGDNILQKINEYSARFERERLRGYKENRELTSQLATLSKKYDLYLWTSNMEATVKNILDKHELTQYFKQLITRDKVRLIKPYPDGFELIEQAQPLEKTEYLMIGDSTADKDAAASAGIDFFPITYFK